MYERRLWIVLAALIGGGVVLIARLFQLQVLEGAGGRAQADEALLRAPQYLAPIRGRIVDRTGCVLASDEPATDLCAHYGMLAMRPAYVSALARDLRRTPEWRGATASAAEGEVRERIRQAWIDVAAITGVAVSDLAARRDAVCRRVQQLREHIARARFGDKTAAVSRMSPIAEEEMFHPLVRDLSPDVRTQVELRLTGYRFLRLEPAVRRMTADVPAMCHLIGRLGEVSQSQLDADADAADELGRYMPRDLIGVSGVERLGEPMLRGRRGLERRDLDGNVIERIEPGDGTDVRLTIDLALQQRMAAILQEAVAAHPPSTGASCVVIALPSREVLALVSLPTFEQDALRNGFAALRDDVLRRPLVARAIADEFPPGSIIKPVTLLTALAAGELSPGSQVECRGQLFPDIDAWRCWTHWRKIAPHGVMDAESAIQHSCNIYFYTAGQRLGADRLTDGVRRFVYGPGTQDSALSTRHWRGTGLVEERRGLIPSAERLRRPLTDADARNYAIGQGELQITPLQAANLMATLACGNFLTPCIVAPDSPRTAETFDGVHPAYWRLVRSGLHRCVNEPGGTAHPEARIESLDVCGKTGSAESVPRVLTRQFEFAGADGQTLTVAAPTIESARERLKLPNDARPKSAKAISFGPPDELGKDAPPTHAWFAGFAPRDEPRIALAVLLEYGGGGGRVAAPIARRMLKAVQESPHGYLPPPTVDDEVWEDVPGEQADASP